MGYGLDPYMYLLILLGLFLVFMYYVVKACIAIHEKWKRRHESSSKSSKSSNEEASLHPHKPYSSFFIASLYSSILSCVHNSGKSGITQVPKS
jgi:hypothetical protein